MKKSEYKQQLEMCRAQILGLERMLADSRGDVEDLRQENQRWAEAQDSVRAEWLGIVEALGKIVPVIEGESTLSMVERIHKKQQEAMDILGIGDDLLEACRFRMEDIQVLRLKLSQEEDKNASLQVSHDLHRDWIDRIHQAAEANGWHMMMAPLDQWVIAHLMAPQAFGKAETTSEAFFRGVEHGRRTPDLLPEGIPPMPQWPSDGCTRSHPHENQPGVCDGSVWRSIEQHQQYTRDLEAWACKSWEAAQAQAKRADEAERTAKVQADYAGEVEKENLALEAERDALKVKVIELQESNAALGEWKNRRPSNPSLIEALTLERDALRAQLDGAKRLLRDSMDLMEARRVEEAEIRKLLVPLADSVGIAQALDHSTGFLAKAALPRLRGQLLQAEAILAMRP